MEREDEERVRQKKIPVSEIFGPTIQGEGAMIGVRTSFIRFGLCDYRCVMCDSMHAVDPLRVKANATWMSQDEIAEYYLNKFEDGSHNWCTLSGGNPCIHDLTHLVNRLQENGINIAVETQGTKDPDWLNMVDCLTVSPKGPGMGEVFEADKFQNFVHKFGKQGGFNVKVVVFDQRDIEFAKHINEVMKDAGLADKMYLSLGNPWPPGLDGPIGSNDELILSLTRQYRILAEDILQDKSLYNVKFLPQLHVLAWANRQCV